jgi:hypothetical protein
MRFLSWVRHLTSSPAAQRNQEGRPRPQRFQRGLAAQRLRFVPRLEALEDRTVLSTLTVLNTADSGAGSLREAIATASSGDTIDFAHNLSGKSIVLTSGQLVVSKDLDIEGPKMQLLTISGNGASRVFDITAGATVTIAGLTIANGLAQGADFGGGGILNESGNKLTLNGDLLAHNVSLGGVGGGLWNQPGASATVSGCSFSDNQAIGVLGVFGAPGDSGAEGGGIDNDGTLSVTDSTLSHNQAVGGADATGGSSFASAGGLANDGNVSVTNSTFTDNQARAAASGTYRQGYGGGFFNFAQATVTGCAFTGNEALGGPVTNGVSILCQAGGGGIANGGPLIVTDSSFTGNRAVGGSGATSLPDNGFESPLFDFVGTGGGILSFGNNAITTGGPTLSVTNGTFTNNEAIGGAGGPGGPGSTGSGGGLEVGFGSKLALSASSFFFNAAVGGAGGSGASGGDGIGGGVDISFDTTATISNTTIAHNSALGGAGGAGASGGNGWGGGLSVGDGGLFDFTPDTSSVSLSDSTIAHNLALGGTGTGGGNGSGGGAFIGTADASLHATGSKIVHNSAIGGNATGGGSKGLGKGGGIYNVGTLSSDATDVIDLNSASTSNDNIFP